MFRIKEICHVLPVIFVLYFAAQALGYEPCYSLSDCSKLGLDADVQDEKIYYFTQAIKRWKSSNGKEILAYIYNQRGLAYGHKKQFNKAISDFNKALKANPNDEDAKHNRDYAQYLKTGKLPKQPKIEEDECYRFKDCLQRGIWGGSASYTSIDYYNKAIKLWKPKDGKEDLTSVYYGLWDQYRYIDIDKKKASIAFQKIQELEHGKENSSEKLKKYEQCNNIEECYGSFLNMLNSKDCDGVLNYADQLISLGVDNMKAENLFNVYLRRGLCFSGKKKYPYAEANLTKAIELMEFYPKVKEFIKENEYLVYSNRAGFYGIEGKYESAIEDLSKVIELNPPKLYDYYEMRARAYESLGEFDKAQADREMVTQLKEKETTNNGEEKNTSDMVLIPAGEFTMGSTEEEAKEAWEKCKKISPDCGLNWFQAEKPKHKVVLGAYYIDKYDVTNAQYKECVNSGKCEKPFDTEWYDDSSKANHPVVYVNWSMADTFCKWAGKRLPTEAEWEKAARGENGNVYPWGNTWDCKKSCNSVSPCRQKSTCAVGSYSTDVSSYGVYDMAGNVWEWVSDWYDEKYYENLPAQNPKGPENEGFKVRRGGSWGFNHLGIFRSVFRNIGVPSEGGVDDGFRCAGAYEQLGEYEKSEADREMVTQLKEKEARTHLINTSGAKS